MRKRRNIKFIDFIKQIILISSWTESVWVFFCHLLDENHYFVHNVHNLYISGHTFLYLYHWPNEGGGGLKILGSIVSFFLLNNCAQKYSSLLYFWLCNTRLKVCMYTMYLIFKLYLKLWSNTYLDIILFKQYEKIRRRIKWYAN